MVRALCILDVTDVVIGQQICKSVFDGKFHLDGLSIVSSYQSLERTSVFSGTQERRTYHA